ncbi:hypothetical protein ABT234_21040 [Streptomyces sp. NPDC001586]|uniref:hypothetical protein n=1 Tax=Streptomyces TaxID=1883 RepID=UPI002F91B4EF|nr:hypothetical protein OG605_39625 [Streptomyces xanthophaeus]
MPTPRTLKIGTALATAALVLTGCADNPVEHGEVIDKRGYAGSWISEYKDVYRDNCTTVRTSSFTASLAGRPSGGSSGGKSGSGRSTGKTDTDTDSGSGGSSSSTSGGSQPGKSLTSGGTSGTTPPGSSSATTGNTQPSKRCERQYVGREKTGQHWRDGKWELQLRDGDRTGWITVSETTYNDTDLHDHI